MIIVIDAYNVLKQALSVNHIADASRQQFINQLSRYGKLKGHSLICVFDGGPYENAHKERINSVYVVYSGMHESADEWIKQYMERYKAQDLLLISTDRELNRYVKAHGIESLDAVHFYAILQATLQSSGTGKKTSEQKLVKLGDQGENGLDELMEEASRIVVTKTEDMAGVAATRKSQAHTMSKKERKLLQQFKKL
ncbi:MAG: NYN domain-containing protein [Candidatus Dependentiae bacterium]|nr:NYN domain-containing protein [Candidatus Dependentiae bacterium]